MRKLRIYVVGSDERVARKKLDGNLKIKEGKNGTAKLLRSGVH